MTVPGDALLDLHRGIFIEREPRLLGGRYCNAPCRRNLQCRCCVAIEKKLLKRNMIGAITFKQEFCARIEPLQPLGKGHFRSCFNNPVINNANLAAFGFNRTVTEYRIPGINAQNNH